MGALSRPVKDLSTRMKLSTTCTVDNANMTVALNKKAECLRQYRIYTHMQNSMVYTPWKKFIYCHEQQTNTLRAHRKAKFPPYDHLQLNKLNMVTVIETHP